MKRINNQVELDDGRKLGYSEFGDLNGFPVINNHGGCLCRLDIAPADDIAKELGIRIISPDRPGIGLSDPKADRRLLDWAGDVHQLADQLNLKQFGVMGWSMGGQYALACAYRLVDRVSSAAVMAGAVPLDNPESFDALNKLDQLLTSLSNIRLKRQKPSFSQLASWQSTLQKPGT